MTDSQSHYDVLGVSEEASQEEIKDAFFELVREHPPEQDPDAYQRLREAYDVLSDPVSRREYDTMARHGDEIETLQEEAEALLNQEHPDTQTAIKKLKRAAVLGPDISLLRNMLGQAYLMDGQPGEALSQFDEAVDLNPDNEAHHLNRGYALRELERPREAEEAFRAVWENEKGRYAAARGVAGALADREQYRQAHEVLDEAIWADDVLNFEDFFCYYDKLQIYVAQGKTEVLKDELETVKSLPETEEDRKYAAFMLSQTGQTLVEVNVYRLAQEFVDAAVELDSQNSRLQAAQDFVQENAKIERGFEEIAETSSIHDFVKHVVSVFYQQYLGVVNEQEAANQIEEINAALENVMRVDPDNTEIKESVRHIRDQHPKIFQLNENAFEAILSMPEAPARVDDCPHCGEPIQFMKHQSGKGECTSCYGEVEISGNTITEPSGWWPW